MLLALPVLATLVAVGVGGSAAALATGLRGVGRRLRLVLAVFALALVVLALVLVVLAVLVLALVVLAVFVPAAVLAVVGAVLLVPLAVVLALVVPRRLQLDLAGDLGPDEGVLLPVRADLEELDLVASLHDVRLGVDLAVVVLAAVVVPVGERDPRREHQERCAAERSARNDLPEHLFSHDLRHSIPVVLSPTTVELRPTLDGFMTYEGKDSRFDLCCW
ncbi:hypothetical protein [Micromonospora sp. NRRL B-16802]|uniref:hypothetical protein n=1 Tax=Micromonospora sp. NRRL B-16802 TaxID=1415541 RepID=UPI001E389CD4|nr:hypothetical protein [Micromonospora sp. NRRL B-16802]